MVCRLFTELLICVKSVSTGVKKGIRPVKLAPKPRVKKMKRQPDNAGLPGKIAVKRCVNWSINCKIVVSCIIAVISVISITVFVDVDRQVTVGWRPTNVRSWSVSSVFTSCIITCFTSSTRKRLKFSGNCTKRQESVCCFVNVLQLLAVICR